MVSERALAAQILVVHQVSGAPKFVTEDRNLLRIRQVRSMIRPASLLQ